MSFRESDLNHPNLIRTTHTWFSETCAVLLEEFLNERFRGPYKIEDLSIQMGGVVQHNEYQTGKSFLDRIFVRLSTNPKESRRILNLIKSRFDLTCSENQKTIRVVRQFLWCETDYLHV